MDLSILVKRVLYALVVIVVIVVSNGHFASIAMTPDMPRIFNDGSQISKRIEYKCGTTSELPAYHDVTELSVVLIGCKTLPVRLFMNSTRTLRKLVITAELNYSPNTYFSTDMLYGLNSLEELELHGFADIHHVERNAFRHLRNIRRLYLNSFGVERLALSKYSDFLQDFSGSPLTSLGFNDFRRIISDGKDLNFDTFLNISNVSLLHFAIDNSVIKSVSGRLSKSMPSLRSMRLSLSTGNDHPIAFIVDAFLIHKNLSDVHIYGFGEQIPLLRFDYNEKRTKGYDDDIRNIVIRTEIEDKDCPVRYKLVLSSNLSSATLNNILLSEFPAFRNKDQICFEEANMLQSLDMSDSTFPSYLPIFSGLINLRTINFRRTGISEFSYRHLEFLPNLEHYLLGGNDFNEWIETDYNSLLFRAGHNLVTLDLSNCKLTQIPFLEFKNLRMLRTLDLSGNQLKAANFSITNSTQLTLLNISNNAIEQLLENFTSQIDIMIKSISRSKNDLLKIDIRGNPLSCLCNATNFVEWMQKTKTIDLLEVAKSNTCLYPNGSRLNILDADTPRLKDSCETLNTIKNNTECSCDEAELTKLYSIRYSLVDYYCAYPDGKPVEMKYIDSDKLLRLCKTVRESALFVGLLSSGLAFIIIIVLLVMFLWIYKKKRPADYQQMLACLDLGRLSAELMGIISHHKPPIHEQNSGKFSYDAFVAYNASNIQTRSAVEVIISKFHLIGITIVTEDDFVIGSCNLDALLESIAKCRMIILVITPAFISDDWCREMTIRAIARQNAVVPIVFEQLQLEETDSLFRNIIATCSPIHWSDGPLGEETMLKQVKKRLDNITR